MKKILSMIIMISTLSLAEIDMKSMFEKAKDAVADVNMTEVIDKAKEAVEDINVTEVMDKAKDAVKDINVTEMIDKAKEAVEDVNMTEVMDKAKDAVKDINVTEMIDKAKDAVDVEFSWQESLKKAYEKAKDTDKRVMVMVEGENCRWCKKMLHRTIADEGVQKRLVEKYVSVRVDREDPEAMKNLPEVRGVPTVFFMDKDNNIVEEVIGYFDVLDFTSYMNDVEKKITQKEQTLKTGI